MPVGIYPVFDPPLPEAEFDGDGAAMLDSFSALEELAEEAGVPLLSAYSDMPDEGDSEALDETGMFAVWHDIDDGISTIDGILHQIEADPGQAAELVEDIDALTSELQETLRCLRIGAESEARFRLEMG